MSDPTDKTSDVPASQIELHWYQKRSMLLVLLGVTAVASGGVAALMVNISERRVEQKYAQPRLVDVGEDDTDPAKWGQNWPAQYDSYKQTAQRTATKYGGHGGSETLPAQKIERDPWLERMFRGYAFSIDYRDRRGHAFMLYDQEQTKRLTKPQSGSCLHCHASVMPLYRELGGGDAQKGFEASYTYSYQELNAKLHELGHGHPVSCVDCHEPQTMQLRVTRPAFFPAIAALAASTAPVPALPSIERWREAGRKGTYDPNRDATRNEMRSFVCGQCHVEYYCATQMPLTVPWGNGLSVEAMEQFWNEAKLKNGERFYDYEHAETGAPILKAQHPEFEVWSQGTHARAGVSCSDCHMPYVRQGASKVSDHWVRSPLLNVNRACQSCHRADEKELLARVDTIQERHHELLQRGGVAIVALIDAILAAKAGGASDAQLERARELQRKAQWHLDFIAAENSMGFHAPQEAARVLALAIDYARQGELAAVRWSAPAATPNEAPDGNDPAADGAGGGAPSP